MGGRSEKAGEARGPRAGRVRVPEHTKKQGRGGVSGASARGDLRCGLQWDCAWSRALGQGHTVGLGHRTLKETVLLAGVCAWVVFSSSPQASSSLSRRGSAAGQPLWLRITKPTVWGTRGRVFSNATLFPPEVKCEDPYSFARFRKRESARKEIRGY